MKPSQFTFLHITLLLSFLFLGTVISPFLTTLILAAILVTGTYPLYEWILHRVHGKKRLAAVLVSLSIGVIFGVVFLVFFLTLSQEAVATYQSLDQLVRAGKLNINELIGKASRYLGIQPVDVVSSVTQAAQTFSSVLVAQSAYFLKSVSWLILNFFLLVFAMYFFFKDGKNIVKSIEDIIPLPSPYAKEIMQKFQQVSLAMLYGIFLTAIVQGILGGIGLAVAGIHNPIFWGTIMAFLGMLPLGGTGFVWLPAAIFLILEKRYFAGVSLMLWGGLIVAVVDNIIKPYVISKETNTYPLATFLVVIGGLMVFGLKGAIIAPMVLAGLVSLIHIYQLEKQ